jgi:hypothetical protein
MQMALFGKNMRCVLCVELSSLKKLCWWQNKFDLQLPLLKRGCVFVAKLYLVLCRVFYSSKYKERGGGRFGVVQDG